jgi:hypothetical protein
MFSAPNPHESSKEKFVITSFQLTASNLMPPSTHHHVHRLDGNRTTAHS